MKRQAVSGHEEEQWEVASQAPDARPVKKASMTVSRSKEMDILGRNGTAGRWGRSYRKPAEQQLEKEDERRGSCRSQGEGQERPGKS